MRGNGARESGHDAPQLGPTVGKLAIPGWYSGLGCQPVRCCAGHDYWIWPGWTGGHENAVLRRRASRVRYHPVGAENRVTLCDLGVLVNEAAKPVSSQNAPSGAVAGPRGTSEVYGRNVGGPAARIISRFRANRLPVPVLVEITDRVHRPCEFRIRLSAQPEPS